MDEREVVGRESEATALGAFVDALPDGRAGVVIEGEPGIGKSTIWRSGCELAVARQFRVARSQPAEAEARLSFSGLADLVGDWFADVACELPRPQARALGIALRHEEPAGAAVDQYAVAAGLRSILTVLARQAPVVLAIDDVQWLDRPSASVVTFALRRLPDEPIGLLVSRRRSLASPAVSPWDGAAAFDWLRVLTVGPLGREQVEQVIRVHLRWAPPLPTLGRIARVSGGNPLYALEIARALLAGGRRTFMEDSLELPADVTGVLAARIARLPRRTREALLVAALCHAPTTELLARAIGPEAVRALARAEQESVVVIDAGAIRFTHPLLAFAARARSPAPYRRRAHRLLAEASVDDEERARHLAISCAGPDEDAARSVEQAAFVARARGAPDAAAELVDLAVALTPASRREERDRRRCLHGELLFSAGDTERSRATLQHVAADGCAPAIRARALLLLARIAWLTGTSVEAAEFAERALDLDVGPALEAEIRTELAYLCKHDRRQGIEHAQRAVSILEGLRDADPGLLARALFAIPDNEADLGGPVNFDLAERAIAVNAARPASRVADSLGYRLGTVLRQGDQLDRARGLFEEALAAAREQADESSLPTVLDQLGCLEVLAGNWERARGHANAQLDAARRTDQEMEQLWALETLASIDAHEGRLAAARTRIREVLELSRRVGDPMSVAFCMRTLGFIELSRGELRAAVEAFRSVDEIAEVIGVAAPGAFRHDANHIEALVELGDLDRADALLNRLSDRGQAADLSWVATVAARCRALHVAATGDLDRALDEAGRAVDQLQALALPFELGRAHLVRGRIHRRRREKRLARQELDRAAEIFERLGAGAYAERARAEARRLGLRPRAPEHLTETERRVAQLAARGLSNPEIAARLFISRKTVESNLGKAYRKLDVRGRGELAARREQLPALD